MKYLITFSYDGTKFHGFQRQKDQKNVQSTLEYVFSAILQEKILIKGSGRTDAGVHALNQCAHFETSKVLNKNDIKKANGLLNEEIIIKSFKKVNDDFHARHSVKEKTYIYKIYTGKYKDELNGYYYQIKYNLALKEMKKACKLFEGTYDFRNFVSGKRDDYVSTIFKVSIKKHGKTYKLKFVGKGFYRYMVRHLVGAIIDVGRGKESVETVKEMLEKPMIFKNLSVVPADGLYLAKIVY